MTKKIENNISSYPNSIDTRVALLEMSISNINDTLGRIEHRLDKMDDKIDGVRKEMKSDFRWILAFIVGLAGVMAHGFHWI